jgi:glucose/arabinose dehydrogenase
MRIVLIALLLVAADSPRAQAPSSPQPKPADGALRVTTIANGLEHPWALEFLPDGRMIVTERAGRLRLVDRDGARPEIWSYGHRNVQAAALHPDTGQLWTVEHGARGGDELNQPQAGKNYGWPVITYGREYSGFKIGEGTSKPGMEQPVYYWDPVIAPSGAQFYTGSLFPDWKGNLLIGSLTPGQLVRLEMKDGRVASEHRYAGKVRARIRDFRQAPDGAVSLITDESNGRILRIEPAR